MTMSAQQIAKKFQIKFVVLDNKHALCHQSPIISKQPMKRAILWPHPRREPIMRPDTHNGKQDSGADPATLALMALGWILADGQRADRLLALTGLDSDALRAGIDNPAILSAVLAFLADHEPDLIACAEAIDTRPDILIAAQESLSR